MAPDAGYGKTGGLIGPAEKPPLYGIGRFAKKVLTPQNLQAVVAGVQAGGILRRGAEAEEIAAQRAAIDRANAVAVRKASIERAKILAERGERFKARQTAAFISGGVRTNVGVPLLVEAQTRADIYKDMRFSLDVGRAEAGRFETSALLEERIGRFKKRKSKFEAIGVIAEKSLAFMGT